MQLLDKINKKITAHPIVFFVITSLIQYRQIVFFGKKIGWDTLDAIFPNFLYMVDCFKNFSFPYYNPLTMGGISFGQNFFTAFLFNPLDVALALIAMFVSPLYVFQLQFPVFATLSGYWFYKFLKKNNQDELLSIVGGLAYFSGIMYPLAGQLPFFYSLVLFTFLLTPFNELVSSKKWLNISTAIILLVTFLMKAYFFFIPFLMVGAFLLIKSEYRERLGILLLFLGIGSILYLVLTYPVLSYLKLSLIDLNGTFVSPEPRLRSLAPEYILYASSIVNVIGDIIDSRLIAGGAKMLTTGLNLAIFYLFLIQVYILFKEKNNFLRKTIILLLMILSMFAASGSFNLLHKSLPIIGSFRWGFSYVHFSQICYLLLLCLAKFQVEKLTVKAKSGLSIVFLSVFLWIIYQRENTKPLVLILPVLCLIYIFHRKESYFLVAVAAFTFIYLWKSVIANDLDGASEFRKIANRVSTINIEKNIRDVAEPGNYRYEDRDWIYEKIPTLNGYNNSIHPIFWYLKSHQETEHILIPICDNNDILKKRNSYPFDDNVYLESLKNDILNYIRTSKCSEDISKILITPAQIRFVPVSAKTLILQNINGFQLQQKGLSEHELPGGMRIIESMKGKELNLKFNKTKMLIPQIFLVLSFGLFFIVIVTKFRNRVILRNHGKA